MNNSVHDSPLGKTVAGSANYDPGLLFPIARAAKREQLGIAVPLPFRGVDIWNAYELSWLDLRGKPQVAIGEFRVPAESPHLIESKSLKLYLNSLNQSRHEHMEHVRDLIAQDLSAAAGCAVGVELKAIDTSSVNLFDSFDGNLIDDLDIAIDHYGPPLPGLLGLASGGKEIEESLISHLLKSNCPVTGQPDWASVQIRYNGRAIDRAGLLRYLVSFRLHDDFHEQCVERIFTDIARECSPRELAVYARYTRRGGLDINPWRSSFDELPPDNRRLWRQ